jgi:hypothetical protein
MGKLLTRDEILDANDLETMELNVPEWGGLVRISLLSASAMDAYESSLTNTKGRIDIKDARAKFLAEVLVDGNGKKLFTKVDIKGLGQKSTKAHARVYKAAMNFNALTEDEIETIIKN